MTRDSPAAAYGRFLYSKHPEMKGWNAAKWNCVFRAAAIQPGPLTYRCLLAIGTVEEVRVTLQKLAKG
jgi:hypothetical protein